MSRPFSIPILTVLLAASVAVGASVQAQPNPFPDEVIVAPTVPVTAPVAPGTLTAPAVSAELRKRDFADTVPVLGQIKALTFTLPQGKAIDLETVLKETREHAPAVRQSRIRLEAARKDAKSPPLPNVLTLFNPVDMPNIKQAAEANAEAARYQLQAVVQRSEIANAKLYLALTDATLNRELAFGQIEQGRRLLRTAQERFVAGETARFDVTRAELQLIARYQDYLKADGEARTASRALSVALGREPEKLLVSQDAGAADPPTAWDRVSDSLTMEDALDTARDNQPEAKAVAARRRAAEKVGNLTNRNEANKAEWEEKVLSVSVEEAKQALDAATRKAFDEYTLSITNLLIAEQQQELAGEMSRQAVVSEGTGFSSANEVADVQLEARRIRAARIHAALVADIAQLQLLAEMGQLEKPEGK